MRYLILVTMLATLSARFEAMHVIHRIEKGVYDLGDFPEGGEDPEVELRSKEGKRSIITIGPEDGEWPPFIIIGPEDGEWPPFIIVRPEEGESPPIIIIRPKEGLRSIITIGPEDGEWPPFITIRPEEGESPPIIIIRPKDGKRSIITIGPEDGKWPPFIIIRPEEGESRPINVIRPKYGKRSIITIGPEDGEWPPLIIIGPEDGEWPPFITIRPEEGESPPIIIIRPKDGKRSIITIGHQDGEWPPFITIRPRADGKSTDTLMQRQDEEAIMATRSNNISMGTIGLWDYLLAHSTPRVQAEANQVVIQDIPFRGSALTRITFIRAIQTSGQLATARILAGGLGMNFVTIRLTSARGSGFQYSIDIWGR